MLGWRNGGERQQAERWDGEALAHAEDHDAGEGKRGARCQCDDQEPGCRGWRRRDERPPVAGAVRHAASDGPREDHGDRICGQEENGHACYGGGAEQEQGS